MVALRATEALDLDDLAKLVFLGAVGSEDRDYAGKSAVRWVGISAGTKHLGSPGDTGFGITAMCIGAERGWVARADALTRVRNTPRSFADGPVKNEHGWFYHWINVRTGGADGDRLVREFGDSDAGAPEVVHAPRVFGGVVGRDELDE